MSLKTSAMGTALKYTLRYVKQNPEENLTKILNLAESVFPRKVQGELEGSKNLFGARRGISSSDNESVQRG